MDRQSRSTDTIDIFNNILDPILIIDKDYNILDANSAFLKFCSTTRKESIGKKCHALMHGTEKPRPDCSGCKAFKTKKENTSELYHPGMKKHLLISAAPILDEDGSVAKVVHQVRDVTELKKAEETLRSESDFSKSLVDTAQAIVLVLDTEGRIVSYNPYLEEISGYRLEDVKGKDWFTTFLPECDYDGIRQLFNKAIGDIRTRGNVNPIITKDGREIFIEWHDKTLKDCKGNITGLLAIGQDVTERKKAEEAIRESEEKYRQLAQNMKQGLFFTDKGTFVEVNKAMGDIFGYSTEELVGMHSWRLVLPEIQEDIKNEFFGKVKMKDIIPIEVSCLRKDGSEIIVEVRMNEMIEGRDYGLVTDITERKNAEQVLKESEERFKLLYSTSRDALMTLEPPLWKFTAGNPATVEMFRTKDEKEFISLSPWELSPQYQPDGQLSMQKAKRMIAVAMENGSNFFEWTHKRSEGEEFPATVLLTKFRVEGKDVVQATVRDITEQKNAEHAIKESEEKHRQLVENINDVLFTITPDEVIRYISPQVKDLFGYAPDDVVGKHFGEFVHPDDQAKLTGSFKDILSGRYYPCDYRINHRSGRPVWVRSSSRLTLKDGKVTGIHGRLSDITKEKELELEKEALHIKAKERLIMIQKQNIQLITLQKRLKQYANKLEIKVKKLEESRLDLTDKERLVFYALVACPGMNDRELAEKTKLKRSTVTSIKNRLKEEKLYQEINLPDLATLGCGLMTAIYGKFNQEYGEIKRMREKVMSADVVFAHTTETGFFALTATKDLVSFHKDIGPSITFATKAKAFKDYPSIAHFPLELSIIQEFFNFAPALRESFSMTENFTQKPAQGNPERQPLNKNAKEVLYALVKHPEAATVELAKMLRLTRGTVSRIRNDLFRQGIVKKLIVPDIKRLNYAFSMVCHFKQAPGIIAEAVKKFVESSAAPDSITHLALLGTAESMGGRLFKDSRAHAEFMSKLIREMKMQGLITEDPAESILQIQETKQFMFSFAPVTKKMLGIEKDF
jgi:PAS domain S-box-containing protein